MEMIRVLAGQWSVQVPVGKLQPDSRLKTSGLMDDGGASTCVFWEIGMSISHSVRISFPLQRLHGAAAVALIPAVAALLHAKTDKLRVLAAPL